MLQTRDDEALLRAERTSTFVMVAILIALMFIPDIGFGCGAKRRGALVGKPIIPDTPAEKRGERLFYRYCSTCHPGGEAGLGPALNDKPLPEIAVRTQIRKGVGAMPAFAADKLTDDQVAQIATFVSELRQTSVAHR